MEILRKVLAWGALAVAVGIVVAFALPSYRQGEASIAGQSEKDFALEISGKPVSYTHLTLPTICSV